MGLKVSDWRGRRVSRRLVDWPIFVIGVLVCMGQSAPSCCPPVCTGPNCSQASAPTNLDLATLAVKGPLTLQGVVPSQCTPWPTGKGVVGQSGPCPAQINGNSTTPGWKAGDGFTVTDGNPSATFPKMYVPSSSVNFQADVAFADDTSVLKVSHAFPPPAARTCTQNSDCPSGVCQPSSKSGSPRFCTAPPATCDDAMFPGAIEGNHAHYTVTVQRWDKTATSCNAPQPSLDPDYPAVRFDSPSPTGSSASVGGGAKGCWVDLASGATELFGSSAGAASSTIAAADGLVQSKVNVAVNLTDVATYLRYVVTVSQGDSRVPASTTVSGWAPGRASPNMAACNPNAAAVDINAVCPLSDSAFRTFFPYCTGASYYDWTIQHPTSPSLFSYSAALNPFQLIVQPLALAQLKVMPYTLIYQPPGDASKATFSTTTSFGISMAVDSKLATNQSTTVDNKGTETLSLGLSNFGIGDLLGKVGNISDAFSSATSWDKSTKLGVGTISDVATNSTTTFSSTMSLQLSNSSLTPGATGTYSGEPFWSDTFVLLVHPQVGFWQLGGVPVISMLAAAGTPAAPELLEPTVADLDTCARQAAPYTAGIPLPGTSDVLNKDECAQLLTLDPFYVLGQSLPSLASNPRAVRVGGTDYGVDPLTSADLAPTMSQVITYASTAAVTSVGSYTATVTDVLSSQGTATISLGLFGISGSDKLDNTETTTSSTDWTVTLQSSFTATAQSSTSLTGALDDHHGLKGDGSFLPARPHVEVYQDTLFGSFMFQDPSAPAAPASPAERAAAARAAAARIVKPRGL